MYICRVVCGNTYTENMTLLFSVKMLGARDGHTIDVIFIVSLEEYFVSFILHMALLYIGAVEVYMQALPASSALWGIGIGRRLGDVAYPQSMGICKRKLSIRIEVN